MGEIDDLYKAEAEELDSGFLEELKTTKDKKKSFERYRKEILRARTRFEKGYVKFNIVERRRIAGMKKKLPKEEKFKRLVIEHFDFEFGMWERMKMRWNIRWFNFMRVVRRFGAWVLPEWTIYYWCKVRNIVRVRWGDLETWRETNWDRGKNWSAKVGVGIWKGLKGFWNWVVEIFGKFLFWRKKEVKEEEKKEKKA